MDEKLSRYFELCAQNTRKRYLYVFNDWNLFLEDRYGEHGLANLRKATTEDVIEYDKIVISRKGIASRKNPKDTRIAVRTVNNHFRALRSIHEMLVTEGRLERNVFKTKLRRIESETKRPKRETETIPEHLLKSILSTTDGSKKGDQIQSLMMILSAGALRINEALSLKIEDYYCDKDGYPYLILKDTKSGDDISHPFAKWAEPYLMRQIAQRREDGAKMSDNIFIRYLRNGKPKGYELIERTATRAIKDILIRNGLPNCSSHSFRKAHADYLVSRGVNVEKIRQALRHSSIVTTQGYFSKFSAKESAVNLFSPM